MSDYKIMQKLDLSTVPELKPSPLLEGLPEELKDPACYKEVEGKLFKLVKSDHVHRKVGAYMKCARCQKKYQARKKAMTEFGFKSFEQYMEWKKIMSIIITESNIQLR